MIGKILKDVMIVAIVAVMAMMFVTNRHQVYDMLGLAPPASTDTAQQGEVTTPALTPPRAQKNINGSVVSIPKSKRDGQFWADARVNTGHVNFLVDTGAGAVALTLNDAKKAGIDVRNLRYDVRISTAGGENVAASVELETISIGGITLRRIPALIVKDGLDTSLLGMTFLGQLQKVEATPNALILRL